MRFVLGLLVLCVAAVGLAWWLAGLPGTIALTLGSLTVETSSAIALVVLVVAILVLLVVVRAILWVFGIGTRTGRWRRPPSLGRRRRGDRIAGGVGRGDASRARRESERARKLLGDTPQTLLLAAQSARLGGEEKVAADLYRVLADRPDAALLGLRGLLRQAIAQEKWQEAAAIAGQAKPQVPARPGCVRNAAVWPRAAATGGRP